MRDFQAYIRNTETKEIHRVHIHDGDIMSQESCNIDQIPTEHRERLDEHDFLDIARMGHDELCGHCFSPVQEETVD